MTTAICLIAAERHAMASLGSRLADVTGVAEVYTVTGEWDFVVIVRVKQIDELATLVTAELAQLDGIARTNTMVAFEAFSKHDLEALFSIGA